jgi:hypothetical protein
VPDLATSLVLWLCVLVPIAAITLVAIGVGLLCWRIVARMETHSRDMLKAVLVLSGNPGAMSLAGGMEQNDGAVSRAQAEATKQDARPRPRMAQ